MIVGICEDTVPIRQEIRREVEKQQTNIATKIYEYSSGEAMLESNLKFDLVFLDIELEGQMTGLELAQQLELKNPDLIFVFISGYTKYVSSAFHLHTFQFLLKPIDAGLFQEEFKRCVEYYRTAHDIFSIPQGGETIEVEMKDIMYIESNKRKLIIHLRNNKEYEMYGKISEQEEYLSVHHFIRIHKSYLVNCRYIKKMADETVSLGYLPKDEPFSLPVSRRCKEQAKERYRNYFFRGHLMSLVNVFDFLAVVFNIVLVTVYFRIFFKEKAVKPLLVAVIYLIITILYYYSSIFLPEAYQKTVATILIYIILSSIWKGNFLFKVLLSIFFTSITAMIEAIVAILLTIFNCSIYRISDDSSGYIIGVCMSNLCISIVLAGLWILWRKKLSKNISIKEFDSSQWNGLFAALIIITVTISYGLAYLTIRPGLKNGLFYFFILECLLLTFDIAIFLIFQKMVHLQQEKMQTVLILQQNIAQQAFYEESIEKNQQMKKLIHDEKNFLLGVVGYLKYDNKKAAMEALAQRVEQLVDTVTDYTGHIALDTVLSAKIKKAKQQNIIVRPAVALYNEVEVDFMDLVLILGNVLDNAIEATVQVSEEMRIIHLNLRLQNNFLIIEATNPVKSKIIIQDNHIKTTKKNKELHGIGLNSVEILAKKYNGTMHLYCDDSKFKLSIVLENVGQKK